MTTYSLRVWTGPTLVQQLADKLREAGIHVACQGTENLYLTAEGEGVGGAAHNVLAALMLKHGTDFGLRPRGV